jgi:hypothetical protein
MIVNMHIDPAPVKSATQQLLPLDQLGAEIVARIDAGDRAKTKANNHYLAAGLTLLEAQKRVDDLSRFLKDHCHGLKRSRAYQLMRIADGKPPSKPNAPRSPSECGNIVRLSVRYVTDTAC